MVKEISQDEEFSAEMERSQGKLLVVDFFATWCGPCQRIAPTFEELSNRYPQALFLKVDVDKCPATAGAHGVSAMPTFLFFLNKTKVDSLRGADPQQLEAKIKHWAESVVSDTSASSVTPQGQMDLMGFLQKQDVECLNESDDYTFKQFLDGVAHLESDCDEQLILFLPFNQPVKIHSLRFKTQNENGPKTVKIFANVPKPLDFDQAESLEPVQQLDLTQEQVREGEVINLRYVKFQNIQNIQLFLKDNQTDSDCTRLEELSIFGTPINAVNMSEFKRVAGKKGESHF